MTYPASKLRTAVNLTRLALFSLAISLPLVGSIFRFGITTDNDIQSFERKTPAKLPRLDGSLSRLGKFPKKFEIYYDQHIGFRKPLLQTYSAMKYALGVSFSKEVQIGKEDWLFYGGKELVDRRVIPPFTSQQLADWRQALEQRRDWLAAQGIDYIFVVAPNKDSIYPEFLPDSIQPVGDKSRLDQLLNYLKATSDLKILDLRSVLRAEKARNRLYLKHDSHWNHLAAFIAYQSVMKRVAERYPKLQAKPLQAFGLKTIPIIGGDLASFLALNDRLYEEAPRLIPKFPLRAQPANANLPNIKQEAGTIWSASEIADPTLPRAYVAHDSFFLTGFKPLLSEHFSRVIYVKTAGDHLIDPRVVREEHPNVVIQEMVERNLIAIPPGNYSEIATFRR